MTNKMVLFPSIGRMVPFTPQLQAFTEIRVKHEMEMVPPQQSDDYFRIRDNIKAEAEIVADLPSLKKEDKGALVETTVHHFPLTVPPVMMNFFDSPLYLGFGPKLRTKFNMRARTIHRFLEAQEAQTRFDERVHDEPQHGSFGGQHGSTLSLPGVAHHGMNPIPRRNEISQLDVQNYERALDRFRSFIDKKNKTSEEEILPVRRFFAMLREQHGGSAEIEKIISEIEHKIASEMERAIRLFG